MIQRNKNTKLVRNLQSSHNSNIYDGNNNYKNGAQMNGNNGSVTQPNSTMNCTVRSTDDIRLRHSSHPVVKCTASLGHIHPHSQSRTHPPSQPVSDTSTLTACLGHFHPHRQSWTLPPSPPVSDTSNLTASLGHIHPHSLSRTLPPSPPVSDTSTLTASLGHFHPHSLSWTLPPSTSVSDISTLTDRPVHATRQAHNDDKNTDRQLCRSS